MGTSHFHFFKFYFSCTLHIFKYFVPDRQLLVTLFWEYFLFLGFKVNCATNSSENRQNGLEGRQKYVTVWVCEGKRAKECVEIFSS